MSYQTYEDLFQDFKQGVSSGQHRRIEIQPVGNMRVPVEVDDTVEVVSVSSGAALVAYDNEVYAIRDDETNTIVVFDDWLGTSVATNIQLGKLLGTFSWIEELFVVRDGHGKYHIEEMLYPEDFAVGPAHLSPV